MMEARMARVEERLDHLVELSQQTLAQVKATNGRVGALERWRWEEDARQSERRAFAVQAAERAAETVAAKYRRIGVVLPVGCVALGAALGRAVNLI